MELQQINESTTVLFNLDLEAFFAVKGVIDYQNSKSRVMLFSDDQIEHWEHKYRFFFETYRGVRELLSGSEYDCLLDIISDDINLDSIQNYLLSMETENRLFRMIRWQFFGVESSDEILLAINDDDSLDVLYQKVKGQVSSYIAFASLLRQNDRFYREYFELANEMRTNELSKLPTKFEQKLNELKEMLITKLQNDTALEISQQLMKKRFNNVGPYSRYYFILSIMIGFKGMRFFYDDGTENNVQIVILNVEMLEQSASQKIAMLKSLSDETKFKILQFISKNDFVNGKDITAELKLAPSTISHHMTGLKECGLVTEEPVKNSKYYGISTDNLKEMIEFLNKTFELK